jgi:tripartite-type tricarboxylate transporter receptor subunit TctC
MVKTTGSAEQINFMEEAMMPEMRSVEDHRLRHNLRRAVVLFACCLAAPAALAAYPERPIRLVIPSVPGGGTDLTWRLIAPKLSAALGQSVVADNRGGAGADIGANIVSNANADGYTLLGGVSSLTINPAFKKNMPYDVLKDLAPVSLATTSPNFLLSHPSVPAKTVPQLIDYIRKQPQPLQFASAGVGSMPHLMMELFLNLPDLKMIHVPYRGTGQATGFVIGGQVPFMTGNLLPVLPHVKSGRLRAYAVTSAKRSPAAPDVPTLAESGVPGYEAERWFGMWVPAGTPRPIVTQLHKAMVKVLNDPEVRERATKSGATTAPSESPEAFGQFIRAEMKKWAKVIKSAGLEMK